MIQDLPKDTSYKNRRAHTAWLKSHHNDVHYPGNVTIHYPLHPFHGGEEFPVVRRFGCGRVEHLEVQTKSRRQLIPAWMANQDRCQLMSLSADPQCSLKALWDLIALLEKCDL